MKLTFELLPVAQMRVGGRRAYDGRRPEAAKMTPWCIDLSQVDRHHGTLHVRTLAVHVRTVAAPLSVLISRLVSDACCTRLIITRGDNCQRKKRVCAQGHSGERGHSGRLMKTTMPQITFTQEVRTLYGRSIVHSVSVPPPSCTCASRTLLAVASVRIQAVIERWTNRTQCTIRDAWGVRAMNAPTRGY